MNTDLNEITVVLSPDLSSVGLSSEVFSELYDRFEKIVNGGVTTVTGYCNNTFGRPTHVITHIARQPSGKFQARIAFLESHPDTGQMATALLKSALQGQVKWLFAITQNPLEIKSIEAITPI